MWGTGVEYEMHRYGDRVAMRGTEIRDAMCSTSLSYAMRSTEPHTVLFGAMLLRHDMLGTGMDYGPTRLV